MRYTAACADLLQVDLCHGPHVPNTGLLKAVGVNSMSRAFWRADVNREPLQVRHSLFTIVAVVGVQRHVVSFS